MSLLWSPFGSRGSLASLSHFAFLHWWSMLPSCPMSVESAHQCVHSDGQDFLRLEALDVSGGGKSARVRFQERGVKVTSSVQRETCKWRKRSGSTNASCEDSIASTWDRRPRLVSGSYHTACRQGIFITNQHRTWYISSMGTRILPRTNPTGPWSRACSKWLPFPPSRQCT